MSDVVVIGLGADGSAAAAHLARRGERVLGLEVRRVPLFWFEPPAEHEALAALPVYIVDSGRAHGCYGFPYLADQGLKVATHGAGTRYDPDTVERETTADDVAPVERFLADHFPAGQGALRSTTVCMYTVTPDEHFVIDAEDRVVYASACSGHGFKFLSRRRFA